MARILRQLYLSRTASSARTSRDVESVIGPSVGLGGASYSACAIGSPVGGGMEMDTPPTVLICAPITALEDLEVRGRLARNRTEAAGATSAMRSLATQPFNEHFLPETCCAHYLSRDILRRGRCGSTSVFLAHVFFLSGQFHSFHDAPYLSCQSETLFLARFVVANSGHFRGAAAKSYDNGQFLPPHLRQHSFFPHSAISCFAGAF